MNLNFAARGFEIVTRGFKLVARGFELVTRKAELVGTVGTKACPHFFYASLVSKQLIFIYFS